MAVIIIEVGFKIREKPGRAVKFQIAIMKYKQDNYSQKLSRTKDFMVSA